MTQVEARQGNVLRELDRAIERIMSIEIDAMHGDNLAVTLCSYFEDADDDEEQDDNGWKPSAIKAYDEINGKIAELFSPVRVALSDYARHAAQAREDGARLALEAAAKALWDKRRHLAARDCALIQDLSPADIVKGG